ncbi:hypothetical protein B484DRAFT_399717, partial [Ochromonadaceae sp. CCMP2298]
PETGKRRLLQRADLADVIKATAVSFGMPPSAFSTSSGRKGYTTHCIANGMQAPEMHQRADWARGSTVPLTFYNTQVTNRGMMALEGDAFGIGDVRRQVSRPVAQYPGADDTALPGQGSSSGPGGELPDKGASDTVRGEGAGESSSSESDYSDDSEDEGVGKGAQDGSLGAPRIASPLLAGSLAALAPTSHLTDPSETHGEQA